MEDIKVEDEKLPEEQLPTPASESPVKPDEPKSEELKVTPVKYNVSIGEYSVFVEVNDESIDITTGDSEGDSFVFQDDKSSDTIKRWKKIIEVLSEAVKIAETHV